MRRVQTIDDMIGRFERLESRGADPEEMHRLAIKIVGNLRNLADEVREFSDGGDMRLRAHAEAVSCEFEYAADKWQGVADGLKEFID